MPMFGFQQETLEAGIFCRLKATRKCPDEFRAKAHVAQLVEHVLGKDEVTGSSPVVGSTGTALDRLTQVETQTR